MSIIMYLFLTKGAAVGWWVLGVGVVSVMAVPIQEKPPISRPVEGGRHTPIPPGTDQSLYSANLIEGDIYVTKEPLKNAITDMNHLWPHAAIIYKVDNNVGCPDSPQCRILSKAMNHYHQKSCIRFKEWSGEKNFVHIFFNTDNSGACWSPVGRVGEGEQRLSLGQRCWYLGIVVHELGHSIGFWHEMNRPDRDNFIHIYWNNIVEGFRSAFLIQTRNQVNTLGEPFDLKSIMMYDEYAFSKDGVSPTLQAKTSEEIGPIWKKRGLSESDIRRLHKLYHCDGNKMKRGFPYDISCNFNTDTCGFKNGPVAAWHWKTHLNNTAEGYVYTSFESAGTSPGSFTSISFHPTNPYDGPRSPLGCIRFSYLLHGNANASLKLSQMYLDKVTQLVVDGDSTTYELWFNDTVSGDWSNAQIPFYVTRPFKLIYESQFESGTTYGTIGLDNIEVSYTHCPNGEDRHSTTQRTADDLRLSETTTLQPTSDQKHSSDRTDIDSDIITNAIQHDTK